MAAPAATAAAAAATTGRLEVVLLSAVSGNPSTRIGRRTNHARRSTLLKTFDIKLRIHISDNRIIVKMLKTKRNKPKS